MVIQVPNLLNMFLALNMAKNKYEATKTRECVTPVCI